MPEKVVLRAPKTAPEVNRYYIRIADRLRVLKFIALGLLVAFVVVMLLLFRSSITYENLQYMLRDLDAAGSGETFTTINFDADTTSRAALFRGDLAVVGGKTVSLYSISGRRNLSQSLTYSSPRLCTSDKYFLVYDTEGTGYSVFNSYSKLYSETFDYAVTDAALAAGGAYAVVTATREYPYAVYVYNKDFKRIGQYYKNKYVMDVQLRADGGELLLLSFSAEGGSYVTEIARAAVGQEMGGTVTITGAFPLAAAYREDGGFTIIADTGIYFYDASGALLKTNDYGTESLTDYAVGESNTAVITKKTENASENSVVLFDTAGNILYNDTVSGKIIDSALCGRYLYLLFDRSVLRIDGQNGTTATGTCTGGGVSLLISRAAGAGESGRPVVCYKNSAVTVSMKENSTGVSS